MEINNYFSSKKLKHLSLFLIYDILLYILNIIYTTYIKYYIHNAEKT